jgi:hypothetical protein
MTCWGHRDITPKWQGKDNTGWARLITVSKRGLGAAKCSRNVMKRAFFALQWTCSLQMIIFTFLSKDLFLESVGSESKQESWVQGPYWKGFHNLTISLMYFCVIRRPAVEIKGCFDLRRPYPEMKWRRAMASSHMSKEKTWSFLREPWSEGHVWKMRVRWTWRRAGVSGGLPNGTSVLVEVDEEEWEDVLHRALAGSWTVGR